MRDVRRKKWFLILALVCATLAAGFVYLHFPVYPTEYVKPETGFTKILKPVAEDDAETWQLLIRVPNTDESCDYFFCDDKDVMIENAETFGIVYRPTYFSDVEAADRGTVYLIKDKELVSCNQFAAADFMLERGTYTTTEFECLGSHLAQISEEVFMEYSEPAMGNVTLTAKRASVQRGMAEISCILENHSKGLVDYWLPFRLEYFEEGQWKEVNEENRLVGAEAVGHVVRRWHKEDLVCRLDLYSSMERCGEYRIRQDVTIQRGMYGEQSALYAYFTVE